MITIAICCNDYLRTNRHHLIHAGLFPNNSPIRKVSMSLNATSANNYNNSRGYDVPAIGIIQSRVGARTHGRFDDDTARAIYDWQGSSNRMASLVKDGKFGPSSLGVMIAEARRANRHSEAGYLTKFPHNIPAGGMSDPDKSPVQSFVRKTIAGLKMRPRKGTDGLFGWVMKGCFEINIKLNPSIPDASRFVYRQFIRGSAGVTEGVFMGAHNTNWQALGPEVSANSAFKIKGGLPTTFKEDMLQIEGKIEKFGYRHTPAVNRPNGNVGLIDRYLPVQSNGHHYQCRDTFGLEYDRPSVIGTKVRVHLDYAGFVFDQLLDEIVAQRNWSYSLTEIVEW